MLSGRTDYAYRLGAARLAIMRLRFARRWQRLFQSSPSSAHTKVLRGLKGVAILIGMSGSAWLGYSAARQPEAIPVVRTYPVLAAAFGQLSGHDTPVIPVHERTTRTVPVVASAPVISARREVRRIDLQAEATRLAELAGLRKSVGELQNQVQALEQEAISLEMELLDQQIAFARAETRWRQAPVEQRVVYNITNIPVGGSVSAERIESDAQTRGFPAPADNFSDQAMGLDSYANPQRQNGGIDGPQESYPSSGSTSTSHLPAESQPRQETFFGPAEDRHEDWANP